MNLTLQVVVCNIQLNEETSFSHFGPDLESLRGVFSANRCTKTIKSGSKVLDAVWKTHSIKVLNMFNWLPALIHFDQKI